MVYLYEIADDGIMTLLRDPFENCTWGLISGNGMTFVLSRAFGINSVDGGQVEFHSYFGEKRNAIPSSTVYGTNHDISNSGRGVAISYDGKMVAIATEGHDYPDEKARVHIYNDTESSWQQLGDEIVIDSFHANNLCMSDDGTIVAIAGREPRIFQYEPNDNVWNPLGSTIDDPAVLSRISLSSDGKTIAIASQVYSSAHRTLIFCYDENSKDWTQKGDGIQPDESGSRSYNLNQVAISGDGMTVATSTRNGNSDDLDHGVIGYLRIFYPSGPNNEDWEPLGNRIDGKSSVEVFGFSIALSYDGTLLVVSAPGTDEVDTITGIVRVYQLS